MQWPRLPCAGPSRNAGTCSAASLRRRQVLHRQGQRLASCALGASARAPEAGAYPGTKAGKMLILSVLSCQAVMSLGDTWLGQGDAARDESQEEASGMLLWGRLQAARD